MIIGNEMQNSTNFEVIVNHNNIPLTNSVKYLGVILDNKLTWHPHIEQTSVKLSSSEFLNQGCPHPQGVRETFLGGARIINIALDSRIIFLVSTKFCAEIGHLRTR